MSDLIELGPAMRALTEKQRRFVLAMAANPFGNATQWARDAGYSDTTESMARVSAFRLVHDPKIEAAVLEYARGSMSTVGPLLATAVMLNAAADPKHKHHLRAAEMIANRVGLHEKVEQHVTVEHRDLTGEAVMARIAQLGEKFGLDVRKLLGAPVVEAEFKVIDGNDAQS